MLWAVRNTRMLAALAVRFVLAQRMRFAARRMLATFERFPNVLHVSVLQKAGQKNETKGNMKVCHFVPFALLSISLIRGSAESFACL